MTIPELKLNYGGNDEEAKKQMFSDLFGSEIPATKTDDSASNEQSVAVDTSTENMSEDELETLAAVNEFSDTENESSHEETSAKAEPLSHDEQLSLAEKIKAQFGFRSFSEHDEIPDDVESINAQLASLLGNSMSA